MNGSITYDARLPDNLVGGRFSPYHDDDVVLDFIQDDAQRITSIIATVFAIHLGLFFALSANFIIPDLKPDEPEVLPVQIVTFDPTPQAEPEPAPPPEVITPAIPAPSVAPRPKPRPTPPPPQPEPEPELTPPPPLPEPEPEPIPEPVIEEVPQVTPPPPEIISQPVIEPDPIVEPEPLIEPEPLPEPVQEPEPVEPVIESIIEADPIIPETIIEEPLEPVIERPIEPEVVEPEPIIEIFDPLPEIIEPDPIEPEISPEPIIEDPLPEDPIIEAPRPEPILEPELEPAPFTTPDAPDELPTPGVIIEEPLPELPPIEELPPISEPIIEEVITPPAPETIDPPDVIEPAPAEPDIITTAPSILASPDAPVTQEETERAVPQSQSTPLENLLRQPVGLPPATPGRGEPSIAGPVTGGGNEAVPGGGTRRAAPGASGWTLAPSGRTSPGAGYDGLVLDIRCREAGRTHEECPEYLNKFQGRNSAGWERFEGMAGRGTDRGEQPSSINRAGRANGGVIGGGQNIWVVPLGDNSFNNGGPSTTVLDDGPEVSFDREFLNKPVIVQGDSGRVRDFLIQPDDNNNQPDWILPETLPEQTEGEENNKVPDWILRSDE